MHFRQPEDCRLEDSSAAAIAACGMLEIAGCISGDGEKYRAGALALLKTLVEKRCNFSPECDHILCLCGSLVYVRFKADYDKSSYQNGLAI